MDEETLKRIEWNTENGTVLRAEVADLIAEVCRLRAELAELREAAAALVSESKGYGLPGRWDRETFAAAADRLDAILGRPDGAITSPTG